MRTGAPWIAGGVGCGLLLAICLSSSAASPQLLKRHSWLKLRMEFGRIRLLVPTGQCVSVSEEREGQCERLAVDHKTGPVHLRYEYQTDKERLVVQFFGDQSCTIQRYYPPDAWRLSLEQRPDQPVHIVLRTEQAQERFEAPTLWHLLSIYPRVRQELIPCLEHLRPDWQLTVQLQRLEGGLQRRLPEPRSEQFQRLVAQLADARFAQRAAADRQLRSMGLEVLPYLLNLDLATLSAEQRLRIDAIRRSLVRHYEDTPDQVASWLLHDASYWQARALASQGPEKDWALARWQLVQGPQAEPVERVATRSSP